MKHKLISCLLFSVIMGIAFPSYSQLQSCPANINFSAGSISAWSAKTGLVTGASMDYPAPNAGISNIPEYAIGTTGIQVITSSFADPYGGFETVPTINGYTYGYSVKIGSTATSFDLNSPSSNPGGFTRSITYVINVPAGSTAVPYTMTYAYAMVLENGTHNSNEQPLFKATLNTPDSVITCASPQYYLPTFNNAGGGGGGAGSTGATLDTAGAIANGFSLSPLFFLSHAGTGGPAGTLLQDVWTKGWTEVTFDLSAYRGKQVTLTFEADNCAPGAHFAYAYVALRNSCAGLEISGPLVACQNTKATYSVPSLANATYTWQVPAGWTINSGGNSPIITVTPGTPTGGFIIAHEVNGCADLRDTISVTTSAPTVAGQTNSNAVVCAGANNTALNLSGQVGNVLSWIFSTNNGASWTAIPVTVPNYTAQNLTTTTQFAAVIQNGSSCSIDTSIAAIISVDPKSIGGTLTPDNTSICMGQSTNSFITLNGNTGAVLNWQISNDNTNWSNFVPTKTDSSYNVNSIAATTYYRVIVKSGVCPADTSAESVINFINVPFPRATINPALSSICYGTSEQLSATITAGTDYSWTNTSTLLNYGTGTVPSVPYTINATAFPPRTMDYVLTVNNAGCPNSLTDTFHINVSPKISVFAGNDTSITVGQLLQLNATANVASANQFTWTPPFGLNSTTIPNPIASLDAEAGGSIIYTVRATDAAGCYGEDNIKVTVFETGPDIFVPSAFTPNGDGLNDMIKPICVGITQLNFFRIYNRWGQLVFTTSRIGDGWDGKIGGKIQTTANFVFMVQGVDFTGKTISKKGNIALIR